MGISDDKSRGISPHDLLQNAGTGISGTATGGSNTTLVDTAQDLETGVLVGANIKINHSGVTYLRTITANAGASITFDALPAGISVAAGDLYQVPSNPKAPSVPPPAPQYDGVYFDPVAGTAGVAASNGLPENPSKNLADVLTIMATRKLQKIYLIGNGVGPYALTLTDGLTADIVGNPLYDITIAPAATVILLKGLVCQNLNNPAGFLFIKGGDLRVELVTSQAGAASIIVDNGNCIVRGSVTNATGSTIDIFGKFDIGIALNNTGGGNITVGNDLRAINGITNTTANITVYGKVYTTAIAQTDATLAGSFDIYGELVVDGGITIAGCDHFKVKEDAYIAGNLTNDSVMTITGILRCQGTITNTGTLTYMGSYPEQAITINAIVASETDFLNLTSTTKRYTIDDLVLIGSDPGANTIAVKLYKLNAGILTNISTFQITTANHLTCFSLMDMFGKPLLAGDNIKITVQASGGGPYAVTGSYTVRTDNGGTASSGVVPT